MGKPYIRDVNILSQTEFGPPLLLLDTFDDLPVKWVPLDNGAGVTTLSRDTTQAQSGTASLKMSSADPGGGSTGLANRAFIPPPSDLFTVECFAFSDPGLADEQFGFGFTIYRSGIFFVKYFSLDASNSHLYVSDDATGWTQDVSLGSGYPQDQWLYIRASFNLATPAIASLRVNSQIIVPTNPAILTGATANDNAATISLVNRSLGGGTPVTFFDNILISQQ